MLTLFPFLSPAVRRVRRAPGTPVWRGRSSPHWPASPPCLLPQGRCTFQPESRLGGPFWLCAVSLLLPGQRGRLPRDTGGRSKLRRVTTRSQFRGYHTGVVTEKQVTDTARPRVPLSFRGS